MYITTEIKYNNKESANQLMPTRQQLLSEVEHDIVNYQNQGLSYLPKQKAKVDDTDARFYNT